MDELVFEVTQESDGGYVAECLGEDIFTQGATWDELSQNVLEAVRAFFFDGTLPRRRIICKHAHSVNSWIGKRTRCAL